MNIYRIIVVIFAIFSISQAVIFKKEINTQDAAALCIDGSPSFYYLSSISSSSNGLIIYFMNTPKTTFCGSDSLASSLEKCLTIQTQISSFWKDTMDINVGILADQNYREWTKVIIPNCDGALFQGNASIKYKGKDLYLRGNIIVKSSLQYLFTKRYDLNKYENIVLAGNEYGAIGALIWSRYFHDNIVLNYGKKHQYSLIVDSIPHGPKNFKTNSSFYLSSLENLLKITPIDNFNPFKLCALQNYQQQWQCFRISGQYPFINFPIFLIESQYDQATIVDNMGINCIDPITNSLKDCSNEERAYIQDFRSKKLGFLYEFVNFNQNSIWSIGCSAHSFLLNDKYNSSNWTVWKIDTRSKLSEDVALFIKGQRITEFDSFSWPNNDFCSGSQ